MNQYKSGNGLRIEQQNKTPFHIHSPRLTSTYIQGVQTIFTALRIRWTLGKFFFWDKRCRNTSELQVKTWNLCSSVIPPSHKAGMRCNKESTLFVQYQQWCWHKGLIPVIMLKVNHWCVIFVLKLSETLSPALTGEGVVCLIWLQAKGSSGVSGDTHVLNRVWTTW